MTTSRKRVIPEVRNPALELSLVRSVDISTDESREETVKTTAGEPLVAFEGKSNPFIDCFGPSGLCWALNGSPSRIGRPCQIATRSQIRANDSTSRMAYGISTATHWG
jgi:hypothetical protein